MASSITYPDKHVMWWIVGDNIAIATNLKTTGATRSGRKEWQASVEAVSGGVLLHYYAEPPKVKDETELSTVLPVDNSMHAAIVDFVKARLFLDRAAEQTDANVGQAAIAMASVHEGKWKEGIQRWVQVKRDKVGGLRAVRPFDFR